MHRVDQRNVMERQFSCEIGLVESDFQPFQDEINSTFNVNNCEREERFQNIASCQQLNEASGMPDQNIASDQQFNEASRMPDLNIASDQQLNEAPGMQDQNIASDQQFNETPGVPNQNIASCQRLNEASGMPNQNIASDQRLNEASGMQDQNIASNLPLNKTLQNSLNSKHCSTQQTLPQSPPTAPNNNNNAALAPHFPHSSVPPQAQQQQPKAPYDDCKLYGAAYRAVDMQPHHRENGRCQSMLAAQPLQAIVTRYGQLLPIQCVQQCCTKKKTAATAAAAAAAFYCPICLDLDCDSQNNNGSFSASTIYDHIMKCHIRNAIEFSGFFVSKCFCSAGPAGHLHCIKCSSTHSGFYALYKHCKTLHCNVAAAAEQQQQDDLASFNCHTFEMQVNCFNNNYHLHTDPEIGRQAELVLKEIIMLQYGNCVQVKEDGGLKFVGSIRKLHTIERIVETYMNACDLPGYDSEFWLSFVKSYPLSNEIFWFLRQSVNFATDKEKNIEKQLNQLKLKVKNSQYLIHASKIIIEDKKFVLNCLSDIQPVALIHPNNCHPLPANDLEQFSKQYLCIFCTKQLNKSSFLPHIMECSNNQSFRCAIQKIINNLELSAAFSTCVACWDFMGFNIDFLYHIFEIRNPDGKRCECDVCHEQFTTCFELLKHKDAIHCVYHCCTCNMISNTLAKAEFHHTYYHSNELSKFTKTFYSNIINIFQCNRIFTFASSALHKLQLTKAAINVQSTSNHSSSSKANALQPLNQHSSYQNRESNKKSVYDRLSCAGEINPEYLLDETCNKENSLSAYESTLAKKDDTVRKSGESQRPVLSDLSNLQQIKPKRKYKPRKATTSQATSQSVTLAHKVDSSDREKSNKATTKATSSSGQAQTDLVLCEVCRMPMRDNHQDMRLHYKKNHFIVCSKVHFKCSLCSYSTQYRQTYASHISMCHNHTDSESLYLKTMLDCALCSESIQDQCNFIEHFRENHNVISNMDEDGRNIIKCIESNNIDQITYKSKKKKKSKNCDTNDENTDCSNNDTLGGLVDQPKVDEAFREFL